ncbi:MAG: 1-deoxy-D-xylulose-5-phosphate reductoisomerase, partial [Clostridia bacterium]|nr:1-deoxy-D-xylulose-5-phosphate reductoisomerase [Clostridia bacterium]
GELLPVDSEHEAIHQCLQGGREIDKLILTCSGGALRDIPLEQLDFVNLSDVLRHPTWDMGVKITIDCATMVNKALEVAEAHYLFGVPFDRIEVVMHPESIVHSMVRFADGSVLAQMANPDMRLPIQYALLYPHACKSPVKPLDFAGLSLHFDRPDPARYPLFDLGVDCLKAGGRKAVAFVASDEIATKAFADGSIGYGDIHTIIKETVSHFDGEISSIEELEDVYRSALDMAGGLIK